MSEIIKIAGVGLVGGMLSLFIRRQKPEFAILTALITSLVISGEMIVGLKKIIEDMAAIIEECGVDIKYFAICIKAVGIAYISQFAAEILRDGGEGAIASKVEAAGKISILILTMPVMTSFLRLCVKAVHGI